MKTSSVARVSRRTAIRSARAREPCLQTVRLIQRVPHQPTNLSQTEAAIAIVARNDANEQENVELYEPEKEGE